MTEEKQERKPFVIGEYVRCPHYPGLHRLQVLRTEKDGVAMIGSPVHDHPVQELHHGYVKMEWIDDD